MSTCGSESLCVEKTDTASTARWIGHTELGGGAAAGVGAVGGRLADINCIVSFMKKKGFP